jgi:hypothetical protein
MLILWICAMNGHVLWVLNTTLLQIQRGSTEGRRDYSAPSQRGRRSQKTTQVCFVCLLPLIRTKSLAWLCGGERCLQLTQRPPEFQADAWEILPSFAPLVFCCEIPKPHFVCRVPLKKLSGGG